MPSLRLAVTLPGAASLGSFEGGALAAIVAAAHAMNLLAEERGEEPPVIIDALAGASAGAITGLVAARAVTAALNPVALLWRAWVEEASLARLRCASLHSPLSLDALADSVAELLDQEEKTRFADAVLQPTPVRLRITLCCLHGLKYDLADLNRDRTVPALTFRDWSDFEFASNAASGPNDRFAQFVEPQHASALEVAIASAANPLAFAPRLLNRRVRPEDCRAIEANLVSVPADGWLWYSDGGIANNEPLSHAIRLAKILDDDEATRGGHCLRTHVVIHPAPNYEFSKLFQLKATRWKNSARRPTWSETLLQAGRIALAQSSYDDLRGLVRDNKRLRWKERLASELEGTLTDEQRRRLSAIWAEIREDRQRVQELRAPHRPDAAVEDATISGETIRPVHEASDDEIIRGIIDAVSGLRGREPPSVAIIGPSRSDEAQPVCLKGASLGHFGGFLDRADRAIDFLSGYDAGISWLRTSSDILNNVNERYRNAALSEVERLRPEPNCGSASLVRWAGRRAKVIRLGVKVIAVAGTERVLRLRPRAVKRQSPDLACGEPNEPIAFP